MDTVQEKKWFVYLSDHHEGPFSLDEIEGKMLHGQVSAQNYVWAEGMPDWELMPRVADFSPLLDRRKTKATTPVPMAAAPATIAVTTAAIAAATDATEPPKRSFGWLKGLLVLMVPALLGLAIYKGYLNPILDSPAMRASINAASDVTGPKLLWLAEKFPILEQWVSPLPALSDVGTEEYTELKTAALAPLSKGGPKFAAALSKNDIFTPAFYVAANLPDGMRFDVFVQGVQGTLLNQLSFLGKLEVPLTKKLGKTSGIRLADGRPLPRGEYKVFITEAEQQSNSEVTNLLASMEPSAVALPAELPRGRKLVLSKSYFFGGIKDPIYEERLKEYHGKLKAKASAEIGEIRQFAQTLDSQLSASIAEFARLRKGHIIQGQQKGWQTFHEKWVKLDEQLIESFKKWTPEAIQNDFFYGKLYQLTNELGKAAARLHAAHNAYFATSVDPKSFEIQLGEANAAAQTLLSELRSKIEQAEKLVSVANAVPGREGL